MEISFFRSKFGVLLLALVPLYLTWTFDHDLWNPDETRDAGIAAEMMRGGDFTVPKLNGEPFLEKPPLYYWSCALIYNVTGAITAGTTRLPSALYGMLGVIFTFLIGRRLFGERAAFFGAAILATSLQYFRMSHFAMMDIPLAALIAGALYFHLIGSKTGFALFTVLAFFAKGFLGIVLPGIVVTFDLLLQRKPKALLATIVMGALMFMLLALPWLWNLWKSGGSEFLKIFLIDNHWARFTSDTAHHSEHFWFFYFLSFLLDFLPWSPFFIVVIVDMVRNPQKYLESPSLRFLCLWFFGLLLFFTASSSKRGIYLLPLFPAAALLCGVWFDQWGKLNEKKLTTAFGSLAAVIALSSFFVAPYLNRSKSFVPVCDAVNSHREGRTVIGYNLNEMERGVFSFYLKGSVKNPKDSEEFAQMMKQVGSNSFCLIVSPNKMSEISAALPKDANLIYEHRPDKKTRSYRVYSL